MRMHALMFGLLGLSLPLTADEGVRPLKLEQAGPRDAQGFKFPLKHRWGPVIPGLSQGAVPQGLAYLPREKWLLVSCYFDGDAPSMIAAIDFKTGRLLKSLTLLEEDGTPHAGHVGGIAVGSRYVWVGSDDVYRIPLESIVKADEVAAVRLRDRFSAECRADFVSYNEKTLWVGEFVLDRDADKDAPHHLVDRNGVDKYAWICGYRLDKNGDLPAAKSDKKPRPQIVLSVREKVQGMAFAANRIVLSVSYGRRNRSRLGIYSNPLAAREPRPHGQVRLRDGSQAPFWFLDGKNRLQNLDYPPMAEGIVYCGKELAVLCESGAKKYQLGGKGPLDFIVVH